MKQTNEARQIAEIIRQACVQAALNGYEDARMSGLCHEGAWELAIDSIRSLKLEVILQQAASGEPESLSARERSS